MVKPGSKSFWRCSSLTPDPESEMEIRPVDFPSESECESGPCRQWSESHSPADSQKGLPADDRFRSGEPAIGSPPDVGFEMPHGDAGCQPFRPVPAQENVEQKILQRKIGSILFSGSRTKPMEILLRVAPVTRIEFGEQLVTQQLGRAPLEIVELTQAGEMAPDVWKFTRPSAIWGA